MKNNFVNWTGWPKNRTAIIAEIGMNHGGDKKLAWKMIKLAHDNGADFVKVQSFVTKNFLHPSLPYYSGIESMELSFNVQRKLFKLAKKAGIRLITTPYDFASVEMVEEFDPPAYKIASMDNDNIPLIRYIANKQRPVIISCGIANLNEIKRAVTTIKQTGNNKFILLHCVSNYPTKPENLNLSMLHLLIKKFKCPVGLSDHTIGLFSSYTAVSLGIAIIEKHFTTNRALVKRMPDADHDISLEPNELKNLKKFCCIVPIMLGKASQALTKQEFIKRKTFKRGIYARRDIKAGECLTLENTVFLRPVKGIRVSDWDKVYGRVVKRNILKLNPIFYFDLELSNK